MPQFLDHLDYAAEQCDADWSGKIPKNGRDYVTVYFQRKPKYTVDELVAIQTGRNDPRSGQKYSPSDIATSMKNLRTAQRELAIVRFSRQDIKRAHEHYKNACSSATFLMFDKMRDLWEI